MRRIALGLLVLLLCAGCSGLVPSVSTPTPDTPTTRTAAPVPSSSPTQTPGLHSVPGLSRTGVTSASDLAARHEAVLANTSYTRRLNETTRYRNGSVRLQRMRLTKFEPRNATGRYLVRDRFEGPSRPEYIWSSRISESVTYVAGGVHVAVTYANGTTSYATYPRRDTRGLAILRLTFLAFETRLAGRTRCGTSICYRIESVRLADAQLVGRIVMLQTEMNITEASLVAYIDQEGIVRRYRIKYRAETPHTVFTGVHRVRYTRFGQTTVEEPSWVENESLR